MTHSIRQSWASLPSRPSVACALLALICLSSGIDRVAASPQLISLVFSGQKVSPQRSGADAFRNVALKDGQGRIAVDTVRFNRRHDRDGVGRQ
jgi:hypothetical protein